MQKDVIWSPHYEIIDEKRKTILKLLKKFKDDFYLAGGTALALQIGHRQSIDFDFFTSKDFDVEKLKQKCEEVFVNYKIQETLREKNTLNIILDDEVKISFMGYRYELLNNLIITEELNMASKLDIACMKLSAICGRSVQKDFVDLYFLLKEFSLDELLKSASVKFPTLDEIVILKSLKYFSELEEESVIFQPGFEVDFQVIKSFFESLDFSKYLN
jgi:hypothetical protein